MNRLELLLQVAHILIAVDCVFLNEEGHAVFINRLASPAVHMKSLDRICDRFGRLFDNRRHKRGKSLPLTWQSPSIDNVRASLVKDVLQEGVFTAQFVHWAVSITVTELGQLELRLMNSCYRYLDFLKRLALSQVDLDILSAHLGEPCGDCVAETD